MANVMFVVSWVRYLNETTVEDSIPVAVADTYEKAKQEASSQANAYAEGIGEVREMKLVGRQYEFYVLKSDPKSSTAAFVVNMVKVV